MKLPVILTGSLAVALIAVAVLGIYLKVAGTLNWEQMALWEVVTVALLAILGRMLWADRSKA